MRVDGIDPLILNRVKDQASKPQLQESERSDAQQNRVQQQRQNRAQQPAVETDKNLLQEVEQAVRKLNDTAEAMHLDLRFVIHDDSERWMVQVVDVREDEIVKEIPPEKVLNVVAQIQSLLGVLVDEKR